MQIEMIKSKGKIIILVSICMTYFLTGCTHVTEGNLVGTSVVDEMGEIAEIAGENFDVLSVEAEKSEEFVPNEHVHEQNEAYKLFYGTWEVTSIVSEHGRLGGDEGYEDILGLQITYLPDKYEFGGIVSVDKPNYLMSILPTDRPSFYYSDQISVKTLLPDSDYFVLVQIVDKPTSYEAITGKDLGLEVYVGNEFFIKDDETLYCFNYNCIYELKRVSYVDDYDPVDTLALHGRW